ncbi:uncharacterized protein N7482_008762 [Penicillium canariense]|uniref:Uncharacterized protein n=1 Tax=Penicillium canariense TaxID=189055 RepID=A0A9W9LJ25_9EURO|nr:uncharacterized protein N7482_008762 [Penicillium canariense]KAJ5157662.1 hypothetical protein N7482_008762 [Penicillium canariense]
MTSDGRPLLHAAWTDPLENSPTPAKSEFGPSANGVQIKFFWVVHGALWGPTVAGNWGDFVPLDAKGGYCGTVLKVPLKNACRPVFGQLFIRIFRH